MIENGFELVADALNLLLLLSIFGQEFIGVVADLCIDVGIFDIEVVVAALYFINRDFPCLFGFNPGGKTIGRAAPPVDFRLEFGKAHRLGFVVADHTFRVGVLVIPDRFGGLALGEKKEIGFNAGVGVENPVGEANNGVQVAFCQKFFLEPGFHALAEEKNRRGEPRRPGPEV